MPARAPTGRSRTRAFARYVWAAPATVVGTLPSLLALALGARPRVAGGCIEIAGGRIARCIAALPARCRFAAITFGHVIIGVDHATLSAVRAHEHVHVRQYERYGILFFPMYLGSSAIQFMLRRDPYRDNRFEREACARSQEG